MRSLDRRTIWASVGAAGALVVVSLVLLGLRGGGDAGEAVYRQAERLLKRKDYERALKHFELLSSSSPRSQWADDALAKQGEILGSHLQRHREAVWAYERLLEAYPDSPHAADALMAMGSLCYFDLHDYERAAKAYQSALDRFPDNRELCAEAQLALGRIFLQEKKPEAEQAFQTLLIDYPDKREKCAEAQFGLGRVCETLKRQPKRALVEYQKVVDNYPNTRWAKDAKQAIGWLYYYTAQAEANAKRVSLQLAASAYNDPEEFTEPTLIRSVRACLAARKVEADPAFLMGLSGLAFQSYYSRERRAAQNVYLCNPLDPVCEAFGVRYEPFETANFQEALAKLKLELDSGNPVLMMLALPVSGWTVAIGYDDRQQRVLLQGRGVKYRTCSYKELENHWENPALPTTGEQAKGGRYALYVLSAQMGVANRRGAILKSLNRACRLVRDQRVGVYAVGFRAYEELIADLQSSAQMPPVAGDAPPVSAWNAAPLANHLSSRVAAALYLKSIARGFAGAQQQRLLEAAAAYEEAARLLRELQKIFPHPDAASTEPVTEGDAETGFQKRCQESIRLLEQIVQQEKAALEAMEGAMK